MRTALYGGSFDPIHHGHLILAREAMEPKLSNSPEEFAAFVRKDHAMYEPIVKASGAKVD